MRWKALTEPDGALAGCVQVIWPVVRLAYVPGGAPQEEMGPASSKLVAVEVQDSMVVVVVSVLVAVIVCSGSVVTVVEGARVTEISSVRDIFAYHLLATYL